MPKGGSSAAGQHRFLDGLNVFGAGPFGPVTNFVLHALTFSQLLDLSAN
jgi:hypothetical protein